MIFWDKIEINQLKQHFMSKSNFETISVLYDSAKIY